MQNLFAGNPKAEKFNGVKSMNKKIIIAIVRPHMLDRIVVALEDIEDFSGITVTDVEGFGSTGRINGLSEVNPFHLQKQIQIFASADRVEEIVSAIRQQAHTGKKGDGLIAVLPVDEFVAI